MADENKTPENEASVHDEMEELARIFREELGKAREEAEKAENEAEPATDIDGLNNSYEVEGYAVTSGEKKERKEIPSEELCECCGERPRGTAKDPKSPFCDECAAIMEKYPYDVKGIVLFAVIVLFTFVAIGLFFEVSPIFSNMYMGRKAANEGKLFSAASYYSSVDNYIEDSNNLSFTAKNAKKQEIQLYYDLGEFDTVYELIQKNYDINNVKDKDVKEILGAIVSHTQLGKYVAVEKESAEIINDLENLIGKKIYIADLNGLSNDTLLHDETEEGYTPTGKENVFTVSESILRFYQFGLSLDTDDLEMQIKYYGMLDGAPKTFIAVSAKYLALNCIDDGQFDKALDFAKAINKLNSEDITYYSIVSRISRMKDKDCKAAYDACVAGLNANTSARNSTSLRAVLAADLFDFYTEEALDLMVLGNYEEAYEVALECYNRQYQSYSVVSAETSELLAILAIANGKQDVFDELSGYMEESGAEFSSNVSDYKEGKMTLAEVALSGKYEWRYA